MSNIYTYELLAKTLGWDYVKAWKHCQQYPELGFQVGKKRLFTEQDVAALKAYAEKKGKGGK